MKSIRELWPSLICMALGVSASFPYLAVIFLGLSRVKVPAAMIETVDPFCLGINGLLSGLLSVLVGGIALSVAGAHRTRRFILLTALGITLGFLGILANLWVYHFAASGNY